MNIYWPNALVRSGKRVIIYGAGHNGKQLIDTNELQNYCLISAIIDKNSLGGGSYKNIPLITIDDIHKYECDAYVLSSPLFALEMRSNLCAKGVDESMIYNVITERMPMIQDQTQPTYSIQYEDYTRYRSLELAASLVVQNSIGGALAEAGVFNGDFCRAMNRLMPDKEIYLYDTFEGFTKEDMDIDVQNGYTTTKRLGQRSGIDIFAPSLGFDEQIIQIRNSLANPDKVHFRKGNFPESANEETDLRFSLVSIDMDMYRPTRDALFFFWPRMNHGGYIFLHDYNGVEHTGVKQALCEVEKDLGFIRKMPLSDIYGSIILLK